MSAQDDIRFYPGQVLAADAAAGFFGRYDLFVTPWPNGVIPVAFVTSVTPAERAQFYAACAAWGRHAAVRCEPRTTQPVAYVLVTQDGGGCSAYVGAPSVYQLSGSSETNLDPVCFTSRAVVEHELGHVLGFVHEHQREDRDRFIRVQPANIRPEYRYEYTVVRTPHPQGPYDYHSRMHYDRTAWALDGLHAFETVVDVEIGGVEVSEMDGVDLRAIYGDGLRLTVETAQANPVTLRWSGGAGSYILVAGSQPGLSDYGVYAMGSATSVTAPAPVGVPIYVTAWSGSQQSNVALIQVQR